MIKTNISHNKLPDIAAAALSSISDRFRDSIIIAKFVGSYPP
jgi:hypothetical protein